jgi:hypothetical protein
MVGNLRDESNKRLCALPDGCQECKASPFIKLSRNRGGSTHKGHSRSPRSKYTQITLPTTGAQAKNKKLMNCCVDCVLLAPLSHLRRISKAASFASRPDHAWLVAFAWMTSIGQRLRLAVDLCLTHLGAVDRGASNVLVRRGPHALPLLSLPTPFHTYLAFQTQKKISLFDMKGSRRLPRVEKQSTRAAFHTYSLSHLLGLYHKPWSWP